MTPSAEDERPLLGLATTRELLEEVAVRMEVTQNSDKGRDLGGLCREAIDKLSRGVLDYRTAQSSRIVGGEQPDLVDLVRELREAVGLFAGAMPITPHEAWEEALAEVRRLRPLGQASD